MSRVIISGNDGYSRRIKVSAKTGARRTSVGTRRVKIRFASHARERASRAHCHMFRTLFVYRRITLMVRAHFAHRQTRIRRIADDSARYRRRIYAKERERAGSFFDLSVFALLPLSRIVIKFSTIARHIHQRLSLNLPSFPPPPSFSTPFSLSLSFPRSSFSPL